MAALDQTALATGNHPGAPLGAHPPRDWRRGFWSLIVTQFQTAFNDNALKFLVIYMIVSMNFPAGQRDFLVLVIGALFAIPFLLFSMAGGHLADRWSKRRVTIGTKFLELAVMAFFILGLALHNLPMECSGVFLISAEAALFGPSKYGLLPELLPESRLSWGNGIIELGTFLASVTAMMAAGFLADQYRGREAVAGLLLLCFTFAGLATSAGISRVPAADPEKKFRWNPLGDLAAQIQGIRRDRVLAWAVLGNTYLFFLAGLLQLVIVIYGHDVLRIDDTRTSYLQAAVGIGIGLGSVAAGYLSGGKIEYGLIQLGALGMTVFSAALYSPALTLWTSAAHLALLGFFGGLFAVPLGALIQHRPRPEERGGVIAAANLLSFVGIFVAAGAYYFFSAVLGQNPRELFLDGAVMTVAASAYSIYFLPDSILRFLLWVATHTVYRIRVVGRENIPESGGALFISNHMSFADALLLLASTDRTIRFLMRRDLYELSYIKPFARILGAIPMPSGPRPHEMLNALRTAGAAIRSGEVVCIFAEHEGTRTSRMLPLRRIMGRIMKDVEGPVVPVNLGGHRGGLLSFERRRIFGQAPRAIPHDVTVSFGRPLPPTVSALAIRHAMQELEADAYLLRKGRMRTLHRSLVQTAHRHPFGFAMADRRRPRMKWSGVLLSAIFLARRLRGAWTGQEMVGILLPPSVPAAQVNFAAMLAGKIPVNLDYTASAEALASSAAQCNLQTVVTARSLLEKIPLRLPGRTILIEEAAAAPSFVERVIALALCFLPGRFLEAILTRGKRKTMDDPATVIFSSGSTGAPKAVMLSHFNIASNIEQAGQIFRLNRNDCLLGVLPLFHSFGYTMTLWLPTVLGLAVAYHPSPLDFAAVGELIRDYRVTILVATPTLLEGYQRHCSPEDFGSLQIVISGADKLPRRLAFAFEDRFGIRPIDVYGAAECSPLVAVNARDFRPRGFRQAGARRGRIGRPLPGIRVRIVDPETHEPIPPGAPGLLLLKGPNVMQGYLGKPEWTAAVLQNGWYDTGDIAVEDEDGFLTITDRLSRFSKIGGEMVPHADVEERLQELAGAMEPVFAVTGVPDGEKGERLVVLHTLAPGEVEAVLERLAQSDFPNPWLPSPNQFLAVEELPRLGTGKLDLRRLRELALESASARQN